MEAEGKNTKEEIDKTFFSQSWNNLQCLLTKEAFTEPFQAFLNNSRKTKKRKSIILYTINIFLIIFHPCFHCVKFHIYLIYGRYIKVKMIYLSHPVALIFTSPQCISQLVKRVAHIKSAMLKIIKNKFYFSHNVLIYSSCRKEKQTSKQIFN